MPDDAQDLFRVAGNYQPVLRQLGLDAETLFTNPAIKVWRKLPDRENCTLDATLDDGRKIRLHIKRYSAGRTRHTPADIEAQGIQLLATAGIATVPLVGWGRLADGRSVLVSEDLTGYQPADKLLVGGVSFEQLLAPTADLAARLHAAGLHHRDLYLCHFFARIDADGVDLKLIDPARVRRLPRLLAGRWIVKDLAQFWYSTTQLPITNAQRDAWLARYAAQRHLNSITRLHRSVVRKSASIAAHDARLVRKQPRRNISIPQ